MKNLFKILGITSIFAFSSTAIIANARPSETKAESDFIDCGSTKLVLSNGDGANGFYVSGTDTMPVSGWEARVTEVDGPNFKCNETPFSCFLKKFDAHQFYVCLADVSAQANADDVITIEGDFHYVDEANNQEYRFTVEKSSFIFNGTFWAEQEPEISYKDYTSFSLRDVGCGEFTNTTIETERSICPYNSFVQTTSDLDKPYFAFSFDVLVTGDMTTNLTIRIGSNGNWTDGNYYKCEINNTWGPTGVATTNVREVKVGSDGQINLKDGNRHSFEFGALGVLDSDQTYLYVKFDGYVVTSSLVDELPSWTTRVGIYYGGTNLSLLDPNSSVREAENGKFYIANNNGNSVGLYLATFVPNNAAFDSANWTTRFFADKADNLLLNGQPICATYKKYLVKYLGYEYYVCFGDHGYTVSAGDVLTVQGGWHGVDEEGKKIIISFEPRSFVFDGTKWGYSVDGYDKANVTGFVNTYMHMSDEAEGQCDTYYEPAMSALNALTEEEKIIFATDAEFASAYLRLKAWAIAQGESLSIDTSLGKVTVNSNNQFTLVNKDNSMIIIVTCVSLIGILGTLALISKKRKAK